VKRIFITGTDTDVGKTFVSTWISTHWPHFRYWKPIQCGVGERGETDSSFIHNISKAYVYEEGYKFLDPISPHLASKKSGIKIERNSLILPYESDLIIEGAGGVMVPINESEYMVDLMEQFKASVFVVARTSLGTINHTLLTIEALRKRNLKLMGVIMNGYRNEENRLAIENYGDVKVVQEIPLIERVCSDALLKIHPSSSMRRAIESA
jgi:dethiobiotin synthetase